MKQAAGSASDQVGSGDDALWYIDRKEKWDFGAIIHRLLLMALNPPQ